jgi:chaperonin cofactor prefoldin
LINAVKEINGKYEELKTKNETLENKINELLSKMEMLEKKYFLNDGK